MKFICKKNAVMSSVCLHSKHGFNLYGRSLYTEATCPKCLMSAYNNRWNSKKLESKFLSAKDEKPSITSSHNLQCPTPLTDTISHFASPGGEAELNSYKPHIPLVNRIDDIRPTETPEFTKSFQEFARDCETQRTGANEAEDDQKPLFCYSPESTTEAKLQEMQYGRKLLKDREMLQKLATQQFYKTTTQKLYEGVDWLKVMKKNTPTPFSSMNSKQSSLYGRKKRFHEKEEGYKNVEVFSNWDSVQMRDDYFVKKPIAFVSDSKKTDQIPYYSGHTSGFGEKDIENEPFTPLTTVRTDQLKLSATGRKPHIPGYTGYVSRDRYKEVFTNEPLPRVETAARAFAGFSTYPQNTSKHSHKSILIR